MADLTFNKVNVFVEDVMEKVHNLGSDQLKLSLTNTAPDANDASWTTDITEIGSGNGYTAGGENVSITSSSQTGGTYTLVVASDITWNASSGSIGPFQWLVLYNDTSTGKRIIGYWSRSAAHTITDGNSYVAEISGTIITLS